MTATRESNNQSLDLDLDLDHSPAGRMAIGTVLQQVESLGIMNERIEVEQGIAIPHRTRAVPVSKGKYGRLSAFLSTLKVDESFLLEFKDEQAAQRVISHIAAFGRSRKRTFISRRVDEYKRGGDCLETTYDSIPARRAYRFWRAPYRAPLKRKPRQNKRTTSGNKQQQRTNEATI